MSGQHYTKSNTGLYRGNVEGVSLQKEQYDGELRQVLGAILRDIQRLLGSIRHAMEEMTRAIVQGRNQRQKTRKYTQEVEERNRRSITKQIQVTLECPPTQSVKSACPIQIKGYSQWCGTA